METRELSINELDAVSGGWFPGYQIALNGEFMSRLAADPLSCGNGLVNRNGTPYPCGV
jgi:bacteriocin-like protein